MQDEKIVFDLETQGLDWKEALKPKSSFDMLFHPFRKIQYEDIQFDFNIDPAHFLKWLEAEGEEVTDDYKYNVSKMCEMSCLYIAMLLSNKELESVPVIYYGNFGFWEHFWIGYVWKGQEYFVDLTLAQFKDDAPKLAISKAIKELDGYYCDYPPTSIYDYLKDKRAFQFYINPNSITK